MKPRLYEKVDSLDYSETPTRPEAGFIAQEVDRDDRVEDPLTAQLRSEVVGLQRRELGYLQLDHLRAVRCRGAIGLGARAASVTREQGP